MRYLLKNVTRDPRFASLRQGNEREVQLKPMVGGKPLPPNSTRVLRDSRINAALLDEIEVLARVGNVALFCVGRAGVLADLNEIRDRLGYKTVEVPAEVVAEDDISTPEEVVIEEPAPELLKSEPIVVDEPDVPLQPGETATGGEPDEEPEEEPEEEAPPQGPPVYMKSELHKMRVADLREIYSQYGEDPEGMTKNKLMEAILELQA
jgi:hypothetical protein